MSGPDEILSTYDRVAESFARERDCSGYETVWLARMLAAAPGCSVLDLGCGTGRPLAEWLAAQGARVTGVDGAAAMVAMFRANLLDQQVHHMDMRGLDLGQRFDAILAWNSFFHLAPEAQRAMIASFAAHANPGAALLFTSGPSESIRIGAVGGAPVYHASLAPDTYRACLAAQGFAVLAFVPEDPACRGHSVWLARKG